MWDYTEIETWIEEGRVDCGFLRLPARKELESVFLEQDRLLVVLPEGHPLAALEDPGIRSLRGAVHAPGKGGEGGSVGNLREKRIHPQGAFYDMG